MTEMHCPKCGSSKVSRHMEVLPAECEADRWAPVREEGYQCAACRHLESCLDNNKDEYLALRTRWNDPPEVWTAAQWEASSQRIRQLDEEAAREWSWPIEGWAANVTRERRARELAENLATDEYRIWCGQYDPHGEYDPDAKRISVKRLPQHPELLSSDPGVARRRCAAPGARALDPAPG